LRRNTEGSTSRNGGAFVYKEDCNTDLWTLDDMDWVSSSTLTTTITDTTTTRTTDPAIGILEEKLAALDAKLTEAGEESVSAEELQAEVKLIQESLTAIQTRLNDQTKGVSEQLAAQAADIASLKASLAEQTLVFQEFTARPNVAPSVASLGCPDGNTADSSCAQPSVQSDGDNNLIMAAPGGSVSFASAECDIADLCQLQREHQSLMDKFKH
jgi:hypothetical protein